jgi:hypothetical protein
MGTGLSDKYAAFIYRTEIFKNLEWLETEDR